MAELHTIRLRVEEHLPTHVATFPWERGTVCVTPAMFEAMKDGSATAPPSDLTYDQFMERVDRLGPLPDANCFTLSDGSCVSPLRCMHDQPPTKESSE